MNPPMKPSASDFAECAKAGAELTKSKRKNVGAQTFRKIFKRVVPCLAELIAAIVVKQIEARIGSRRAQDLVSGGSWADRGADNGPRFLDSAAPVHNASAQQ